METTVTATVTNARNSAMSSVIAQNRKTIKEWDIITCGDQIYTIVATSPDLSFKEELMAGRNGLRKEIKAFVLRAIDVSSVTVLEKDVDGYPKMVLNEKSNDASLVFPMAKPDFKPATRANVIEAIERLGKPGSQPVFFSDKDLPMLLDLLKLSNQAALNEYEALARKFTNLTDVVRNQMDANEFLVSEYYRQRGIEATKIETIHVEANVTE